MSLLALLTRSHDRRRNVVKAIAPSSSLTDADKTVYELKMLIHQCKENPLQVYKERFACRMEIHTELNERQKVCVTQYQADLEKELNTLL